MSKIVKTWREPKIYLGEDYTGEIGLAVPEMSMTPAEIIKAHSRGLAIPFKDMVFLDEEEIPAWETMDKLEIFEAAAYWREVASARRQEFEVRMSDNPSSAADQIKKDVMEDINPGPPPDRPGNPSGIPVVRE